ncbi:type VI secretion system membrane subunit TssM [Pseudomonas entomophila]|uniref:type VI secretion system membrane subunit TssM n=1 Tax=Pseudomonas entomophila TaxID=312306 RepID=UPI003EBAED5B
MNRPWTQLAPQGRALMDRAKGMMPMLLGLGAVLTLVAIWWLGPQWTWRGHQPLASITQRSLASLVLIVVALLAGLVILRIRVRHLQAERALTAAVAQDHTLPFVHAQEKALNQALDRYLEHAGGRRALYRLPWYLVVGDECAGKTSVIECSDQRFTLTRIEQVQSRGRPTQALAYPIGWWISDDAVVIDPPGAFIRQPHSEAPGAEQTATSEPVAPHGTAAALWHHLLKWLLRHRSQKSLNGVLLVIDLPALLHGTPGHRSALAHLLRTRLHELNSQLGTRLPVYVVLSKFDLIEGFDAFHADMPASLREHLLGFTFKLEERSADDAWLDEYSEHYQRLMRQLFEQVVDRIEQSGSAEARARLLSLHAQLAGLRPMVLGFLRETLAGDRFTTPALVRGVYWSSVTQQGDVLNAFVREAAQPYGTAPPLREGKPQGKARVYFIPHLFKRVVYQESGLAGDNVKVARHKRRLLWASSGIGLLVLCGFIAGWQRYFELNGTKAANVLAKSREYSHHEVDARLDPTGRNLLAPLDQIRDAVSVFGDYRAAWPGVADLGLYQGRAIGPRVDEAYLTLLSRRFLPALASGVVETMEAAPPGSAQQLAALRVYRMLEDRQNRRPEWVEAWMAHQWQQAFPGQGQLQRSLMRHLNYALAYADTDLSPYRARVAQVQQTLREVPLAQRVYASLKQQAQAHVQSGLNLRHQVGPAFDMVFQSSDGTPSLDQAIVLAPLLTAKGFNEYFEPRSRHFTDMAMIDQWALGERDRLDYSTADREALTERLRTLYSADYIDSWRQALQAFTVTDFRDLPHGLTVLQQMTGPMAPLRRLLETVRDNSALSSTVSVEPATDMALQPANGDAEAQHALAIQRAFAGLSGLLKSSDEQPSYYDETVQALTAVHDYAKAVQDSPDRGKAALQVVHRRLSMTEHDPISALQRMATGLPAPLDRHMKKVADQTAQVLNIEALRELERRWDADVYAFFQQRLAGRYPFSTQAPDASLEDFEAFFGPKGRLQRFHDQYLKVFLKDNLEAFHAGQPGQSLIRRDVIEQLEQAERIRETFFDQRGNLNVQFSIEPLGLSPNQRTSLLDLDGQLIAYTHGPSQITGVVWPNTLGRQVRSQLTLLRQNGNSSSLEYRGPWSMFRLLSRGALNGRTATSVDLSFKAGDGVMRYRLNAEKAFNPITQQPFKDFQLPRGLLQLPEQVARVAL